jgi:hypothetical protein
MHFTRNLSVKHHPNGDHYSVSIPSEIAQALGLQDGGGLVSIELSGQGSHAAILKAYRDSELAYTQMFDPTVSSDQSIFKPVPLPPRTLGPSKPWGSGAVFDRGMIQQLRLAVRWLGEEQKRMRSSRWSGRRPKKR